MRGERLKICFDKFWLNFVLAWKDPYRHKNTVKKTKNKKMYKESRQSRDDKEKASKQVETHRKI